jgi:hypothetical protein
MDHSGIYTAYRVLVLDDRGLTLHQLPCSRDTPNEYSTPTHFDGAALSPDKSMVAVNAVFDGNDGTTYRSVVIYDLDGNPYHYWNSGVMDAAWTPDGRLLMATIDMRFFLTDTTLKNGDYIDHNEFSSYVRDPAVHPDGDYFIFSYNGQIWSMNLDGSNLNIVQEGDKQLRHPAWSPNGNAFVFTAWEGGDYGTAGVGALEVLLIHDIRDQQLYHIDLSGVLDPLGEPWPPLSWTP